MKKFNGNKSIEEVADQCKERNLDFDQSKYDAGSDYVRFAFAHGDTSMHVMLNGFDGRFFGATTSGQDFNSDDSTLDGTPWFDALLDFVYVSEPQAVSA